MIEYNKKYFRNKRLNSFHPLCETGIGRRAIQAGNFPPFIDASCRREPDLEHDRPSITCLCRQEGFAPHLQPNDIVVYITVKGKWFEDYEHYRIIAILEVIEHKDSHLAGASWYRSRSYKLPSNCMVPDNLPYHFHETAGRFKKKADEKRYLAYPLEKQIHLGQKRLEKWDEEYAQKARRWGHFIITKPVWRNYNDPPIITKEKMLEIFGRVPNTRTANKIEPDQFKALAIISGVNFTF